MKDRVRARTVKDSISGGALAQADILSSRRRGKQGTCITAAIRSCAARLVVSCAGLPSLYLHKDVPSSSPSAIRVSFELCLDAQL